jgi:crossover junction endodeoxyribonuclease RuvC
MTDVQGSVLRVLGIDPGLKITGYGIVDNAGRKNKLIEGGAIVTAEKDPTSERLAVIYSQLSQIIEEFKPDCVAVEQLYSHYQHPRTAILMGHARGVIMLAAGQKKLPVFSYAATEVKKSLTGAGRAGKDQIRTAIQDYFRLPEPPARVDVSDALAVALCHISTLQFKSIK